MCLGALVHAGVPLPYLTEQLGRLGIVDEFCLRAELVHRNGQQATKVYVELIEPKPEQGAVPSPQVSSHTQANHTHRSSHHSAHFHGHAEHAEPIHPPINSTPTTVTTQHFPALKDGKAHHHSRFLPEIEALILAADLSHHVIQWSLAIFRRLAEAEGAVHGIAPEQVHFHEVGATDAIVDIVGTCIGLDWLGVEQLYCSPMPIGGGTIWAAHGRLPVPPPAVLKLWEMRQVPLYSNGIEKELVTPTGAAIATTLASQFGAPPPLRLQKVGLGAGSKDLAIPNILRLWLGESETVDRLEFAHHQSLYDETAAHKATAHEGKDHAAIDHEGAHHHESCEHRAAGFTTPPDATIITEPQDFREDQQLSLQHTRMAILEPIVVLETQIDDLTPQAISYTMTELLSAGALDVFTQAIGMKKSRSGVLLTIICHLDQVSVCEAIVFRETTTLGIRCSVQQRAILQRKHETISTAYGPVGIKVARSTEGTVINVQPEYEDCVQLAQSQHLPWYEVHRLALQTWHSTRSGNHQS